ncbi:MAG: hypothetical protein V3U76_12390 [Granulosicoccus sp.]
MLSLYAEITACIVATGLLGLLCGTMMQRSRDKQRLNNKIEEWETKYIGIEQQARQDLERLEDRVQSSDKELKTLTLANHSLDESAKSNEASIQQARADAIELNRRQAETQERLQRVIQQKDREITELRSAASAKLSGEHTQAMADAVGAMTVGAATGTLISDNRKSIASKRVPDLDASIHSSDTIAIDMAEPDVELFDETVRINPLETASAVSRSPGLQRAPAQGPVEAESLSIKPVPDSSNMDDSFEATDELDLDALNIDESTIALDEEALAFARSGGRSIKDSTTADQTIRLSSHEKISGNHKG